MHDDKCEEYGKISAATWVTARIRAEMGNKPKSYIEEILYSE
jgi:hypothetical protein